jgi:hypothetical protein
MLENLFFLVFHSTLQANKLLCFVFPWQALKRPSPCLRLPQCCKTFHGRSLRMFVKARVFGPSKSYQPWSNDTSYTGAYPSEAPFRHSSLG